MIKLLLVLTMLVLLPFLFAYIHARFNQRVGRVIISYRYFVLFNVVVTGFVVMSRVFHDNLASPQAIAWFYDAALISMTFLALFTIFSRSLLMLAPALCWGVFLILSGALHLYEIRNHWAAEHVDISYLHAAYDFVVAVIMFFFIQPVMVSVNRKFLFQ